MESLERFARVEVKSTLRVGNMIWVGTKEGLCRYSAGQPLVPVAGVPAGEVKSLCPTRDGFAFLLMGHMEATICFADHHGKIISTVKGPEGEKIGAVSAANGRIFVGGKAGVFAQNESGWTKLLGEPGFEVIGIWELPDRIAVSVKKQGESRRPALAESFDGGKTWTVTEMGDYGDVVIAADANRIVTRWRGGRPRSKVGGGYKKHPITAAEFLPDGGVVVADGDKIEVMGPGRRKMEVFHPRVADAESVHLMPEGFFFAGVQGAYLLDPLTGKVTDLAEGLYAGAILGKRKKVYALDNGVLLAACTFGTFRSTDAGANWSAVDGEWDVFDAEGIARTPNGRWFLLCQRGLFRSDNNGARWDYVKPKMPHGTRHYGEFRNIAVGAGKVWLGTKAGVFAASIDDPDHMAPVEAFGTDVIEALAFDDKTGRLLAGVDMKSVYSFDPATGTKEALADIGLHEASFIRDGNGMLAVSEKGVSLLGDGTTRDAAPAGSEKGWRVVASDDGRILLWGRQRAWLRKAGTAEWIDIASWPAGTRSVALTSGSKAILTDRNSVSVLALPDVA